MRRAVAAFCETVQSTKTVGFSQHVLRLALDHIRATASARYVASLSIALEPATGRQRRYC